MKRLMVLIIAIILCLPGCSALSLLSEVLDDTIAEITDPAQYGEEVEEAPFPEYFPTSVDDYTVNSYSYTVLAGDPRHEIFLDITVTQEQFEYLLTWVKELGVSYYETEAYYADGYYEIVFVDRTTDDGDDPDFIISYAEIKKVIYNPETLNVVFVDFTIYDAYQLNEIVYFNHFNIDWKTYWWYMNFGCQKPCTKEDLCNTYREGRFDYIEYNGDVYYIINEKCLEIESDLPCDPSSEYEVYILEYDKTRHNEYTYTAKGIVGDTEHNYLYFQDSYYTKDPELASDYYTSPEFLNKFKKDEVRIGE